LERHFESEEVKIIFSLVAFFLGATPFNTPSVYNLLNYTELEHDGYWNVKGGMYKIVEGIMGLLEKKGVKDPGALAAYIGRKKLGKAKFQSLAAKGRRRAMREKANA
jgi:hypothetical protein